MKTLDKIKDFCIGLFFILLIPFLIVFAFNIGEASLKFRGYDTDILPIPDFIIFFNGMISIFGAALLLYLIIKGSLYVGKIIRILINL